MHSAFSSGSVVVFFAALTLWISGCSKKNDDFPAAPPPPKAAEVSLIKPDSQTVPVPGISPKTDAKPQTSPANVPPPTTEEGFAAITKGMSQDEVKEFKETASIEDFDTNIQMIQEAANAYYNEYQKNSPSVDTLIATGFLNRKPVPPKGKRYVIDSESGEVSSVKQ